MSWKLIFGLSLLGVVVGLATIFSIPASTEPVAWAAILVVCGLVIAKRAPDNYFLHGLCVSFLASIGLTVARVALFDQAVRHARDIALATQLIAPPGSLRVTMAITGPVIGLASGIVLGLFAYVASKFIVSSHSEYAGW